MKHVQKCTTQGTSTRPMWVGLGCEIFLIKNNPPTQPMRAPS